jgi:uncharacterized membrane protein HdeD (DUF308 family)
MSIVSTLLYIMLGVFLSLAGVSIIEQPIAFLAILAVVLGIDLVGRLGR